MECDEYPDTPPDGNSRDNPQGDFGEGGFFDQEYFDIPLAHHIFAAWNGPAFALVLLIVLGQVQGKSWLPVVIIICLLGNFVFLFITGKDYIPYEYDDLDEFLEKLSPLIYSCVLAVALVVAFWLVSNFDAII